MAARVFNRTNGWVVGVQCWILTLSFAFLSRLSNQSVLTHCIQPSDPYFDNGSEMLKGMLKPLLSSSSLAWRSRSTCGQNFIRSCVTCLSGAANFIAEVMVVSHIWRTVKANSSDFSQYQNTTNLIVEEWLQLAQLYPAKLNELTFQIKKNFLHATA